MSAKKILTDISAVQGWDKETMLSVVTDFIDEHDQVDSFVEYLQYRVEEENYEAKKSK